MVKSNYVKKMTFSALFLAIAYILPFLTGQIPQIGSMLLPMHLPVLLCVDLKRRRHLRVLVRDIFVEKRDDAEKHACGDSECRQNGQNDCFFGKTP